MISQAGWNAPWKSAPGFPFVALHIAVGEVEPHQIQLTIIGKKLFDLPKHKFQIAVEIAVFIGAFRMVAHWMVHIP